MRLLADENFPIQIVEALRADGHDVLWARTELRSWKDPRILDFAEAEGRILLTLDKDFWQIAVQRKSPLERSGVVLFRVHPAVEEVLGPLVIKAVASGTDWTGHVSMVTAEGVQMMVVRGGRKGE